MTTAPRVALVVPELATGGGVPTVARFVRDALTSQGEFIVTPISLPLSARSPIGRRATDPSTWLRGPVADGFDWDGLRATAIGCNIPELEFQRFMPRRVLTNELRKHDLVLVVAGSPAYAYVGRDAGRPVLVQAATRAVVERATMLRSARGLSGARLRLMTAITGRYEDAALRLVSRAFVENSWMLDYSRDIAGPDKTVFGPPGVDATLFNPRGPRTDLGGPYIFSVARWTDPRKRPDILVEAYAKLRVLVPNAPTLVLAGKLAPPDAVLGRARQLGIERHVRYVGAPSLPELASLYRSASIFALSSDEEGFGMVLVESMASGVPAVSTDCGGPPTIIRDGHNGLLTPVGDPARLAAGLARLCTDPALRDRMAHAAREAVETQFSTEAAGAVYLRHCWSALGETRQPTRAPIVTAA